MLPKDRSYKKSLDLLKGSIYIHVHAGPHLKTSPRSITPIQAALQAKEAGMRAIVFMDVFQMCNGTSQIVNEVVQNFHTFGGINLNTIFGGINPRAVKTALEYGDGAKYVSFGTHSTHWMANREGHYINGKFIPFRILYPKFNDEELAKSIRIPLDKPTSEIKEILEMLASYPDVYLITGHISTDEAIRLVDYAKNQGINKILISSTIYKMASIEQLNYMINQGAIIEYTLSSYGYSSGIRKTDYYTELEYASDPIPNPYPPTNIKTVAQYIKELGPENSIIATDFGVYTLPPPVEGLREFIALLLDLGISEQDINKVVRDNPADLLGL